MLADGRRVSRRFIAGYNQPPPSTSDDDAADAVEEKDDYGNEVKPKAQYNRALLSHLNERMIGATKTNLLSVHVVKSRQRNDVELRVIIDALEGKRKRVHDLSAYLRQKYIDNQFRINSKGLLVVGEMMLVALPPSLVRPYIEHWHAAVHHDGAERTIKVMKQRYFWHGMTSDIKQYVQHCEVCQKVKGKAQKHEYLKLFSVKQPFEMIAVDLMGPLPRTTNANEYTVTVQDRFSRLCRIIPVRNARTTTVVDALMKNWFNLYGYPKKLLSDRGSQFTSELFKQICALNGVKKLYTSAYHPQTDGMVERLHRWIKEKLKLIAVERGLDFRNRNDWDVWISDIEFVYNSTPTRAHGLAPFELIYGRNLNHMSDVLFEHQAKQRQEKRRSRKRKRAIVEEVEDPLEQKEDPEKVDPKVMESYMQNHARKRQMIQRVAVQEQEKYDAQRTKNNKPHKPFQIGQKVAKYLAERRVGNERKLQPYWSNPAEVIEVLPNGVSYRIRYEDGNTEIVHYEKLKQWYDANGDDVFVDRPNNRVSDFVVNNLGIWNDDADEINDADLAQRMNTFSL